jgi:O-antigen/teichoic acid export membrane protein
MNTLSRRLVLSNIGAFVAGNILARLFAVVGLFLIARKVGPMSYGQYAPTLSTAVLASFLYTIGLDNWLLYRGGKDATRLNIYVTATLTLKVVMGAIWLVALLPLATQLNRDAFPFELVVWAMLSIFFEQIAESAWAGFKAQLQNHWVTIGMVVVHGGFLLLVLLQRSLDQSQAVVYMQMRTIATFVGAVASVFWLLRSVGWGWEWAVFPRILRETAIFGVSAVLAAIYARADLTIVGQILGADASAIYAPASSLVSTLYVFPMAGYTVLMPILGRAQSAQFGRYVRLSLLLATLFGILSALCLALFAKPLALLTFGADYLAAADLMPILAWVFALKCVSFAAAAAIVAVGWQSRRTLIQLITAIFNVVANILLIERYGLRGVAWIFVASEAIVTIGYLGLVWQYKRDRTIKRRDSVKR